MNLCTDQLVMMLADRETIVSLSYAALDPTQSLVANDVGDIPLNKGLAEEIVPLAPDIIFSGSFTTSFSDQILRDLGFTVVDVSLSENLDDIRKNIQLVADSIGKLARGKAMVRDLDRALRDASAETPAPARGLVILPGGFTPGQNSIAHEILSLAGIRNVTAELGITYWANITLESVLRAQPEMIIIDPQNRKSRALATLFLQHPALQDYLASRTLIEVPSNLWGCGTPFVADALETIIKARRK
jgi:iron complex transport system substrate-binding protein